MLGTPSRYTQQATHWGFQVLNHLPAHPGGSAAESGSQLSKRESTHTSPRGQRMRPRRRFRLVASRPLESQVSGPGYVILPATGAHTGLVGEPSPGFLGPHPTGVRVFQLTRTPTGGCKARQLRWCDCLCDLHRILLALIVMPACDCLLWLLARDACCGCLLETCHRFSALMPACENCWGIDACSSETSGGRRERRSS